VAALCLKAGVLYVGRGALRARVAAYDLDGHELDPGFAFTGLEGGRAEVAGLAVDEDHRLWIADPASRSLRCFTLFGNEVAKVASGAGGGRDLPGELGTPVDVASRGSDDAHRLLVASRGTRRHALQELHLWTPGAPTRSLRPMGDPNGRFRGLVRVEHQDRLTLACEAGAGRVQVFRDGEFHFALGLALRGDRFAPRAALKLPDGRFVVAHARERASIHAFDAGGRWLGEIVGDGEAEGGVQELVDLACEPGLSDARTRLFALDQGGDRLQVFDLEGRCLGSFPELPGTGTLAPP
jgi:hypothetical protein